MEPFDVFEQNLREMLAHLYDPIYRPPESLRQALGLEREPGLQGIRDAILGAVEELKPADRVPPSARSWRIYGMLRYRYVENLPQEQSAERLGITARHLRRDIVEAVHALALYLWEKQGQAPPSVERTEEEKAIPAAEETVEETEAPAVDMEWQAQLRKEIEALEETASAAGANLVEAMDAVRRLGSYLTERRGIPLHLKPVSPDLLAAIHPSALRQILITVVDRLAQHMKNGEIQLSAGLQEGKIFITVEGGPVHGLVADELIPLREFITTRDGSIDAEILGDQMIFQLRLLAVDRCVLVVDDNADIVHLYRRYVAGTRFYIQHVNQGRLLFDAIEQVHPHVIVLDVMLPDIDGWDLLTRLHENPATRGLPVLVCSVMHEEELALALGACCYLTKPIRRADFLATLNQIQHRD